MAISGGDGSIILTTDIDDSGLQKGTKNLRSEAAKLAAEYRKAGLSQSEAMKKAWSEIERNTKETEESTKATKKFGEQSKKSGKQAETSMGKLPNIMKGIASKLMAIVGVYQLINFGKQAIQLASDLEEVQNVVNVAFGEMTYKMEAFADTAIDTFGISELTAKQWGSTMMAMGSGMGQALGVGSDMALELTGRLADIMSFYNKTEEEAFTLGKAIYSGETEPLKSIGVIMTETNLELFAMQKGYSQAYKEMDATNKLLVRQEFFLEKTKLAMGDYVRTGDSWANQTRTLSQRWKEMQAIFGEAFIAVGTLVLPVINSIISGLTKLAEMARVVAQWIYKAFTGKELKTSASTTQSQADALSSVGAGATEASDGMNALGDATKKAGKEAKKSLAGFDDLEIITSNIAESAGGAGGALGGAVGGIGGDMTFETTGGFEQEEDFSFLQSKLDELAKAFSGVKDIDFGNLSKELKDLAESLTGLADVSWDLLLWAIKNVLVPLSEISFEKLLPTGIKKMSEVLDTLTLELEVLKGILTGDWDTIKAKDFGDWVGHFSDFSGVLKTIKGLVDFDLFSFLQLFWGGDEPTTEEAEKTLRFWGGFAVSIDEWWTDLKEKFKNGWDDIVGGVVDFFTADDGFIQTWNNNISEWWTENVSPWLTKEKWKELWDNVVASVGNFFTDDDGFVQTWIRNITTWWIDNVSPWFTVEKWKEIFSNIITSISEFFTGDEGFVQTWKDKISDWWTEDVAPWFTLEKWKELGTNLKDGLMEGLNGAIGGIATTVNKMIDGFQNLINGAIGLINDFIEGWNTVADVTPLLPSISYIKTLDLSKYKIPGYARGTVVPPNKPFLGVLGDNKNETEVVSPISTLKQAFTEAMLELGGNFGGGNTEVVLEIDGREFGRAVVEQGNRENRRIGTRLVIA